MHELSLMNSLMGTIHRIANEQQARRVTCVRVTLGALSHMSPEHFREHFEQAAHGTMCEGAALEITVDTRTDDAHAQDIMLGSVDVEVNDP